MAGVLSTGSVFYGDPTSRIDPVVVFEKMENLAKQYGWDLVCHVTNHNGVCPAHLSSIDWLQETQWIFARPDAPLILIIEYTEMVDGSTIYQYYQTDLQLDRNISQALALPVKLGQWIFNPRSCSMCLHGNPSPREWQYDSSFWEDVTTFALKLKQKHLASLHHSFTGSLALPNTTTKTLSDGLRIPIVPETEPNQHRQICSQF